ncbi:MAG: protein DpdF [Chloroflexi bacterium]|nr:protein DpdF [Chloroflexota bacterium]
MTKYAFENAFEALRSRLTGKQFAVPEEAPPPITRIFRALNEGSASSLDLAVLIRHALRQEGGALRVPSGDGFPTAADWALVGVAATPVQGAFSVQGLAWKPDWLENVPEDGVDAVAARAEARRREERVTADPFLARFKYDTYRSQGQRRALRAALGAPRGSTLVVSLPTGEGKSLVFHALASQGLGDGPGVTLVVTPTVALAADHEQSSIELGFDDTPLAYQGGNSKRNQVLINRVREARQSLCFASPEAVCTSLREPLREAARHGRLRAIVVDEAHLIDGWGINFRPEFQMLAGLRHELLALSGESGFRTILLSATLTRDSIEVLRTLFPGDPFRIVSAAQLRPEVEFWVAGTTDQDRRASRVFEALLHLPRPLILYTTTRADAAYWFDALQNRGFQRIGTVTGDTPDGKRQQVIRGWRTGEIDLVVGTSAFGLGIDNRDVRAVVHACVPESLDRFYQEVGRGGRDGNASISLLLPSHADLTTARRLSRRQLLTEGKAQHRWEEMFTHEERRFEDGVHFVPVDCRPGVDDREIDMVGPLNTAWNVKTLVLMAAAGGIRLLDVPSWLVRQVNNDFDREEDECEEGPESSPRPRVRLDIIDPMHRDPSFWENRVANFRARQKAAAARSFRLMGEFLRCRQCAADIIAPLYEFSGDKEAVVPEVQVGRACGGCPSCRRSGRQRYEHGAPSTPYPWAPLELSEPLRRLLKGNGQLLVFYGERKTGPLARRRERAALRQISTSGVRNFVLLGDAFEVADFADIDNRPVFTADRLGLNDLPNGPTVVVAKSRESLPLYLFDEREPGSERLWLLDESVPHPSKPGVTLRQAPPEARFLSFAEFLRELEQ